MVIADTRHRLLTSLAALMLSACALAGGGSDPYADPTGSWGDSFGFVEIGGASIEGLDARLQWTGATNTYAEDLELEFDPGLAAFAGFREEMLPWLAAEVSGGILYHNIDQVSGATLPSLSMDASLFQIPLMLNLVIQLPGDHLFTPYAGGGAGAMISWMDIDASLTDPDGSRVLINDSSTEVDFAYHLFAGVRLRAGSTGSISLAYHLFGGGSPTYGIDGAVEEGGTATTRSLGTLRTDDIITHAIAVGFHVPF